jgi:hypothetical protein
MAELRNATEDTSGKDNTAPPDHKATEGRFLLTALTVAGFLAVAVLCCAAWRLEAGVEGEHRPAQGVASMSASDVSERCGLPRGLAVVLRDGQRTRFTMATTREHDQIVETSTQARQAEPGPSVLALLTASTGLAVLILGIIWFVFFRV